MTVAVLFAGTSTHVLAKIAPAGKRCSKDVGEVRETVTVSGCKQLLLQADYWSGIVSSNIDRSTLDNVLLDNVTCTKWYPAPLDYVFVNGQLEHISATCE